MRHGEGSLGPAVGVDCEEVERFRKLLPQLPGTQRRLFSEEEHAHCASLADPAVHYAGRWCAKEAVVKAVSRWAALTPRDVRILVTPSGAPVAALPPALDHLAVEISISHTHTTAVAVALAVPARRRRGGRRG